MSYFIIYEEQFIKLGEDKFIPLIMGGDNNVYNINDNKRSRSWTTLLGESRSVYTKKELFDAVELIRSKVIESNKISAARNNETPNYNDSSFGWYSGIAIKSKHTSGTTYNDFKNVAKRGIKNALTIEDLANKFNVKMRVTTKIIEEDVSIKNLPDFYPKTNQELLDFLERAKKHYDCVGYYISYHLSAGEDKIKSIRRKLKPETMSAPKEKVLVPFFYIIKKVDEKNSVLYYFAKLTSKRIMGNYTLSSARIFKTEKQAQTVLEKIKGRFTSGNQFVIEKVENTYNISI